MSLSYSPNYLDAEGHDPPLARQRRRNLSKVHFVEHNHKAVVVVHMDEGVVPVVMRLLREHAVEEPCGGDGYFFDLLAPPSGGQDRALDCADDRFRSRLTCDEEGKR